MKRFRFPLDRVLRYRQLRAEAEQAKYEACQARVAEIDGQIAEVRREEERTQAAVREAIAPGGELPATGLATYPNYRGLLARATAGLARERRRREEAREQQRLRAVAARQAGEVLVKAREQARRRWDADFQRETEALAGEAYLGQWSARKRAPPGPAR